MVERLDSRFENSERRPASRRRVLLAGLVVYENGAYSSDCLIRSLSQTGARIAISDHIPLPGRLYLINIRDGLAYDALVVWSRSAEIGIKFESRMALSAPIDTAHNHLKRLWLAKSPRGG